MYQHWGCSFIYRLLSYPLRSLIWISMYNSVFRLNLIFRIKRFEIFYPYLQLSIMLSFVFHRFLTGKPEKIEIKNKISNEFRCVLYIFQGFKVIRQWLISYSPIMIYKDRLVA